MHSASILNKLKKPSTSVCENPDLVPIIFSYLEEDSLVRLQTVNKFFAKKALAAITNKIIADFVNEDRTISLTCLNTHTSDNISSKKRFQLSFQHIAGGPKILLPILDIEAGYAVTFKLDNLGDARNPIAFEIHRGYSGIAQFISASDPSITDSIFFKRSIAPIKNKLLTCEDEKVINAIESNNFTDLRKYLAKGIHANSCNKKGKPLLLLAAEKGHIKCVETLLDYKANVDARDPESGATTLMAIIFNEEKSDKPKVPDNLKKLIDLLISRNADVNAQSKFGQTILHYLAQGFAPFASDLTKFFLDKGADPYIINAAGLRPSCVMNYERGVKKLLYRTTMLADASPRIESIVFSCPNNEYNYIFKYKKDLAKIDKRFAWEAIVNLLKSISIAMPGYEGSMYLLGLANDKTSCYFEKDNEGGQLADTDIPSCNDYVISKIDYRDDNSFEICIKPVYCLLPVHVAVVNALRSLNLEVENNSLRSEFDVPVKKAVEPTKSTFGSKRIPLLAAGVFAAGFFALEYKEIAQQGISSTFKNLFGR